MQGLPGTILKVDLSSGTIEKEPIKKEVRAKYVGGRGINVRLLFDEVRPGVDPLSPENRVIFGAGLFSGTRAPSAARFNIASKSALTGFLGDTNAGGKFGPALRRAGIDHIVIKGKADKPVYLWIDDGKVEIRPARHLWGKNIREVEAMIKEELGDKRVQVAAIGQAGENLVRIANVVHDERSASRTGTGAVMGSKNLKAVAVRGTQKVELFDTDGFNRLAEELQQRIAKSEEYARRRDVKAGGASAGCFATDKAGISGVRNYQQAGGFEGIDNFDPKRLAPKYYDGRVACFGCPVGCSMKYTVKSGPYAGEWGTKIEEGAFTPLGPVCGNANVDSVFKMNNMGNQLGVDLIEFGRIASVAMDWYENGIVSEKELDGLSMTWGNHEAMIQLLEKVAFRRGVGDIFAEGSVRAAKKFGREAEKYVSHGKGMVMAGSDPRMRKGMALGLATGSRGADHLRAMCPIENPAMPVITPEEAEAKYGTREVLEPSSYNKAAPVIYYQNLFVIPDLFEVCRFLFGSGKGTKAFSFKELFALYAYATGAETDDKDMLAIAERVYNLERAFSCREGVRRKDDHLVGKWVTGPVPNGPFKGAILDPEKFEGMLDDYYRLRGWDKDGVPTSRKLKELGLEDVVKSLRPA
jgi:aldehyde:ferredoxin oxidoreductase